MNKLIAGVKIQGTITMILPKILLIGILFIGASNSLNAQSTINPERYYTFDNPDPSKDAMGNYDLDFTTYQSQYNLQSNGQVSNFIELNRNSALITGGPFDLSNGVTIEFLFKPGGEFNTCNFLSRADGAFGISMKYAEITFRTVHKNSSGNTVSDALSVNLDGIGRKSYGYYTDGNWHHMVFRFDAANGTKEIWVDGELPPGFSNTVVPGTITNMGNNFIYINHNVNYVKYFGSLDEIALYSTPIPDKLIYKHYLQFQNNQHYSFINDYLGGIPAPSPISSGFDLLEFAPGHPNVSVSALDQLHSFPAPRFKQGHTLLKNFNWMDPHYMASQHQPGVTAQQVATNSTIIQTDLAKNFNYYFHISIGNSLVANAWVDAANANPDFKLSLTFLRGQFNPCQVRDQNKPASHYFQNANGQFLDLWGNPTSNKLWRPSAPPSSYNGDGYLALGYINDLYTRLNRPIDMINENAELFPNYSDAVMALDPVVTADKNASGLTWKEYLAQRYMENETQSYRDIFMSHPQLANAKFTEFSIDGQSYFHMNYEQTRKVNTPINGQYYPTPNFTPRWPRNWRNWESSWHGWQWIVEARHEELALGDRLYSPFVSPGWSEVPEVNMRPAQWLGLLKSLGMSGAEFYYPCHYSLSPNFPDPVNWIWQAVMPSYAQAITSRYEDFLRNGELMEGDVPDSYVSPSAPGYSFYANDLRKLVVIRKHNSGKKYAITGTIQPNSSMVGNAELESVAVIQLDGSELKFKVRRQGSTYIFDNNTTNPVFYQLDEWHETTHPYYWSKDFVFEGELYDNAHSSVAIKTAVPNGTPAGDYTNYTSYITFGAAGSVSYSFLPRLNAPATQYFWVRARSVDGTSTGFTVDLNGSSVNTFDCITDTNWVWYRYNTNGQKVTFTGISQVDQTLRITSLNGKIEIDKIHLTANPGAIYSGIPNPCSTAQASITANGPTSFCAGGNVTLTASAGTSYLWSNGSTSQSINVSTSGTYTVTVTTSGVGSSTSSPATVNVFNAPVANITPSGPTTFCNGSSVTLNANGGASYLWSPGNQTTQSINVSTAGAYSVKVTDNNGCTAISGSTQIIVNAGPSVNITSNGPTNFCQGENVTLSATPGYTYLWNPGNQTTQSINVSTAGSYSVEITDNNGCTNVSGSTTVNVLPLPVATITPSGSLNIISGQTVYLTSSPGSSYLWSPGGQTSQTIPVTTAGSYSVEVTGNNGCKASSGPAVVTVNAPPVATITASGPTTFCQGGLVVLTANPGNSYLWSTGATTSSISANYSGTFTVTVTTNGIPAVSTPVSVIVNTPPVAAITPNGPTSYCSGSTVLLTSSPGNSYLWAPYGQTTQNVDANHNGYYVVTVTDANGCTAESTPVFVESIICANNLCDPPFGLATVDVNSNTATVAWQSPGTGQTGFQVKLKNKTTGVRYVTSILSNSTLQITFNVNPSSHYRWWARSRCGTLKSAYAGFLEFYTYSPRTTSDYNEDDNIIITPMIPYSDAFTDEDEGIVELSDREVILFPNPAADESTISFKVETDDSYTLNVLEANGKVISTEIIHAKQGFNLHTFDVQNLPRGLYFVQLIGKEQSITKRLTVQ